MSHFIVCLFQIAFSLCFMFPVYGSGETEQRLSELEKVIKTQKSQLDNIRVEKSAEIDQLKERILILEANEGMRKSVNGEMDIWNDVKDDANVKKRRSFLSATNIAFHVHLSGDRCYSTHETFVFDVEETDTGNNYDVSDGNFDVPVTGTYVFTLTVGSVRRTFVTAEMIVNGQVKGTAFANSDEINDDHSATGTIVVKVNAGDHVFVRRGYATHDCSVRSGNGIISLYIHPFQAGYCFKML